MSDTNTTPVTPEPSNSEAADFPTMAEGETNSPQGSPPPAAARDGAPAKLSPYDLPDQVLEDEKDEQETQPKDQGGEVDANTDLDALFDRALAAGLSDTDIMAADSVDQLERTVAWNEHRKSLLSSQQQQPPPARQPPPANGGAKGKAFADYLQAQGEDPETWDPHLIAAIDGYVGAVDQRYAAQVEQFAQAEQQRQIVALHEEFDGLVKGLGKDYEGILGSGATGALRQTSPQFYARSELMATMSGLAGAREQAGLPPLSMKQLFQSALRAQHGEHISQLERNATRHQLRNRQGQFSSRPTQRTRTEHISPESRAKNFIGQFLRDHGGEDDLGSTSADDREAFL